MPAAASKNTLKSPVSEVDATGLLGLLRRETADVHRNLEQHPVLTPLTSSALTMTQYQRALLGFLSFYQQLEQRLIPTLHALGNQHYPYQPRTPLLQQDLQALGETPSAGTPVAMTMPKLTTHANLLGALYVLEGSTQGGRIIGPAVCRQLALRPDFGCRFFHLFQLNQWPQCKTLLQQEAEQTNSVAAAREIFLALQQHLDAYRTDKDPL